VKVPGFEKGNFVGPTIIDNLKPGVESYDVEIFGPVLGIVRCNTL
jgi:malonate-semialdehyde dehydrogenase (acetylating)/methylmalonate-semialdehyde dehydrogenase